jgi:trehalose 6-phosphate phosphatase
MFVATLPQLRVLEGKMIREALPARSPGKGAAVEALIADAGVSGETTAYFGDDITDEDAFAAVNKLGGVSAIVGPERPTFATYRVNNPSEMADILGDLVAAFRS